MKQKIAPFLAGFAGTAVLLGTLTGLLVVDQVRTGQGILSSPLLGWRQNGPLDQAILLLGRTFPLPMEAFNTAAGWLMSHSWVIPRRLRLAGQLGTLAAQLFTQL